SPMQPNSSSAFFLSATLHGVAVAMILLLTYVLQDAAKEAPKIFELVAGEGDNYMATAAPALGTEGVKFQAKEAPTPPEPVPVQTAPERIVEAAPVTPAPKPVITRAPPPDAIRDFSKDVKRIEKKRADRLIAKDRAAREAAEKKAKAEADKQKKLTKEEFDKQNKAGAPSKTGTPAKIARIDAEGIAKGVIGGSTANKLGGAGGKALTREEGDALDLYFSLLKRRLKEALDKPPGLSDTLVAIVEVHIAGNGLLSGGKISRSSGSEEFDQAALAAIVRVRSVGPRPDGKSEVLHIPFRMREEDDG
ncbi:MAG: cell envelope integrity protein TolA, partial [Opitutus sp.]